MNDKQSPEGFSPIAAIKRYFEKEPFGRKVELTEFKALSPAERAELGELCRKELEDVEE